MNPSRNTRPKESGRPAKQRVLVWVFVWGPVGVMLLLVLWVLVNFRSPPGANQPLVPPARETTWVTSPLTSRGEADYVAWLNQQHAVTPENNALVGIIRVIGPVRDRRSDAGGNSKEKSPPGFYAGGDCFNWDFRSASCWSDSFGGA